MAIRRPDKTERHRRTLAVLCVVAATLLWASVKLSGEYASEREVPVTYELPDGLAFAVEPAATVTAIVEGTGWELLFADLRRREPVVAVPAERIEPERGEIAVAGFVDQAFSRSPLRVRRVTPERLVTEMSAVATKRVPLEVRGYLGYAANHAPTGPVELSPDSVTLTGPSTMLSGVARWRTDSFAFDGLRDTVVARVGLEQVPGLRVNPTTAQISIETVEVTEKTLRVPVTVLGVEPGDSVVVYPARVRVEATVGLRDYDRLRASGFLAVVDLTGSDLSQSITLPVELRRVPRYVRGHRLTPGAVEVYEVVGGQAR